MSEHTGLREPPAFSSPIPATVKNGELLLELAAREAGRRKHKNWRTLSAEHLFAVLHELGFKIEIAP